MRPIVSPLLVVIVVGCSAGDEAPLPQSRQIIDVHLHALRTTPDIPETSPGTAGMGIVSPATDDELRE